MKADLYKEGKFEEIECPIIFKDEEDFNESIKKAGYILGESFGDLDFPAIQIYMQYNLIADCPYPYAITSEICGVGNIIFIEKWYDVSSFLTNHGGYGILALLREISYKIRNDEEG